MALIKTQNAEGGSDARYDVRRMTPEERRHFDSEGRPLGRDFAPDQWVWTPGIPGARGGNSPNSMGGGGVAPGGSVIPNSGTYLYEQALAQGAYDKAVTALKTQRKQRQITAGMGEDWTVDPKMQYGLYHQMLGGQGMELDFGEANAMDRGLLGAGLGRQPERALRYGHAVQNLGFKNQLSDWENEYQSGIGRAEHEKQMAMLEALRAAQANSYGDWSWGGEQSIAPTPASMTPQMQLVNKDYSQPKITTGTATRRLAPKPKPLAGFGGGLAGAMVNRRR